MSHTAGEGKHAERREQMAAWKLLLTAAKLKRGWSRIPPERRKQLVEDAGKTVRKHGPVVARRVGAAVREARKKR
jgi:hypothetical protein